MPGLWPAYERGRGAALPLLSTPGLERIRAALAAAPFELDPKGVAVIPRVCLG